MRPTAANPQSATARSNADEHEAQLLGRVARSDRRAFEELYLLYHRRLARFLMRLAPRYEIAEEVVNDTFWIVWRKAGHFRGDSRVSTWIMGIAYRRALKSLRRERAHTQAEERHASAFDPMHEEPAKAEELQDWITQGLSQLPLEQRMAIELAYYLGHSYEEIAAIMGCPPTTVKARMFHARARLRSALPGLGGYREEP
jgi:RNA polymerase sigma-70 factor (ECF subfamily)